MGVLIAQKNFNVDIRDYSKRSCISGFSQMRGICSVSKATWLREIDKNIGEGQKAHSPLFPNPNFTCFLGLLKYNYQLKSNHRMVDKIWYL